MSKRQKLPPFPGTPEREKWEREQAARRHLPWPRPKLKKSTYVEPPSPWEGNGARGLVVKKEKR